MLFFISGLSRLTPRTKLDILVSRHCTKTQLQSSVSSFLICHSRHTHITTLYAMIENCAARKELLCCCFFLPYSLSLSQRPPEGWFCCCSDRRNVTLQFTRRLFP